MLCVEELLNYHTNAAVGNEYTQVALPEIGPYQGLQS